MTTFDTSNIKAFLAFPARDKASVNHLLVGIGLMTLAFIIPIIPLLLVFGYYQRLMRRIIQGQALEMPPWEDWGNLFVDGIKFLLINLVYTLPAMLIYFVSISFYIFGVFAISFQRNGDPAIGFLFFIAMIVLFVGMLLTFFFTLLGAIPLPMAMNHAIAGERWAGAFDFRTITRLVRRKAGDLFIAWLIMLGLLTVTYFVYIFLYMSVILCFLTPLVLGALSFYISLVAWAIFAAIYRQGALELEIALPTPGSPSVSHTAPSPQDDLVGRAIAQPVTGGEPAVDVDKQVMPPGAAVGAVPQAHSPVEMANEGFAASFPAEVFDAPTANDPNATRRLPEDPAAPTADDPSATRRLPEDPAAPTADDPSATRRLPEDPAAPTADDPFATRRLLEDPAPPPTTPTPPAACRIKIPPTPDLFRALRV